MGGHWEREGGPPDGTAAGKAGHWLPGVTSGHPSPHPLPAFRAHSPCVGGVSAEEGSGGADTTHVRRGWFSWKISWSGILFFLLLKQILGSRPLYQVVTTDVSMKRSRRHGGQTGPVSPFPFGSVLVLAADQSLAWALAGLTGCLEGGHQVALPWPFLPLRHDMPVPADSSMGGSGETPPPSLATSVMRCDEAASTDPPPTTSSLCCSNSLLFPGRWGGGTCYHPPPGKQPHPLHDPKLFLPGAPFPQEDASLALEGEVPLADHWGDGLRGGRWGGRDGQLLTTPRARKPERREG